MENIVDKYIDRGMNEYPWHCILRINPFATKDDIEKIVEIGTWDLYIKFKTGEKIIYDIDTGYHRNLFYKNIDELSEEEERIEFGYALRIMMRRKGMLQEELAEKVGTTQAMISRYVSGKVLPSILIGRKIAKALKCSMDELFYIDYSKYLEEE